MNSDSQRELDLFTQALALPVRDRTIFLDHAAAGESALRQRVEALLAAHERVGDFLEQSPIEAALHRPGPALQESPGERIGRYRLVRLIGEGGCGFVYLAEQEEPVQRPVALKILKPGMDTRIVIARFEAERQTLAVMDHPSIAKVFDAGATESGRPYFVMELVRGPKITEFCDAQSLSVEARLRLFIQVCQAVQHAHQKGVIHRDIKPSNILVASCPNGEPLPIVIDFGIAKATSPSPLSDRPSLTAAEMLVGTPAYMSPEQAASSRSDVDTRTDIYSLGVLLYELLTGQTPYATAALQPSGIEEVRRVICETTALRPSARLKRLEPVERATLARKRQTDPGRLVRALDGDLDWITMKALEKDRTRRYATANGLAVDLQRFLADEPITARPPSAWYPLAKWIRRHRVLFAALALGIGLLLISLVVISAALARERQARHAIDAAWRQSQADQARAETEAIRSRQVVAFLEEMLQGVGPSVALGQDTGLLRGILDRTTATLGDRLSDQPAVEAQLRGVLGRLYLDLGNLDTAEHMLRTALALQHSVPNTDPVERADRLFDLGNVHWRQRRLAEAETAYREALELRRRHSAQESPQIAALLNGLGAVARRQKRLDEAEALTREGLALRRKLFGEEHLEVADSLRHLAIVLADRGQLAEAESLARRMVAMRRHLLGAEHPLVAASLTDLAWVVGFHGASPEVDTLKAEAFDIRRKLLGSDHPDLVQSAYHLADTLRAGGNLVDARAVLEAVLSVQRRLLGNAHPDVLATLRALAQSLEQEGDWSAAESSHRELLLQWRARGGPGDPQALESAGALARALFRQGTTAEAVRILDETLTPEILERPESADLLTQRMDLLARLGRFDDAARDASVALRHQPDRPEHHQLRATLLARTGDLAGYREVCQAFLARFGRTTNVYHADRLAKTCLLLPQPGLDLQALDRLADLALAGAEADPHALPYFQIAKALAQYRLGHHAEAAHWAAQARASPRVFTHGQACAILAMAHARQGDGKRARAALEQGLDLAPSTLPARDAANPDQAWLAWVFSRLSLEEAVTVVSSLPVPETPASP